MPPKKDLLEVMRQVEETRRAEARAAEARAAEASAAEARTAEAQSAAAAEAPSAAPSKSRSRPARARATPAAERAASAPATGPAGEAREAPRRVDRAALSGIVVVLLVFVLGFVAGTLWAGGGERVEAAPSSDSSSSARPAPPTSIPLEPGLPPSAADRALLDPANRYTVQVITYADSRTNRGNAADNVRYLRESGFPAADPKLVPGPFVTVLVGAAPSATELDDLRNRLRAHPDPTGAFGYASAITAAIDEIIDR